VPAVAQLYRLVVGSEVRMLGVLATPLQDGDVWATPVSVIAYCQNNLLEVTYFLSLAW